jgi:hypothetical protein
VATSQSTNVAPITGGSPGNAIINPEAFKAVVGNDPFSQIMGATQPTVVVERPQTIAPQPTTVAPQPTTVQAQPTTEIPPSATDLIKDALGVDDKSAEENVKAMRRTHAALKKEKEEKEAELLATQERLKKYESGEEIAEPVRQKQKELTDQVEKLRPFRELHALKMSDEYETKYVRPIEELGARASQYAKDYGVDSKVLGAAMRFENKRERNAYLKKAGFDDVGVLEVGRMVDEARDLHKQREAAENKPAETLESLRAERAQERSRQESLRLSGLDRAAKNGMEKALAKIQGLDYPEFQFTGDEKQDEYARKILETASTNYASTIKSLAAKGITELAPEVAEALAETFLYGHAGSVAMASRNNHYQRAEEIKKAAVRESAGLRPQIGSSSQFGGNSQPAHASRSGEETADALLQHIGVR